jgi:uncharacterized membrane protein YtjA (UPF0391 family)
MAVTFLVNFKTNHPTLYLIGILFFLAIGIVLAGLGFGGVAGGIGLGITGVVLALFMIILLIEYFATKNKN